MSPDEPFSRELHRQSLSLAFAIFAIVLGLLAEPVLAAPAMTVPGQSGVSATGAFSYTIPIAVPPGTAGMVPSLSLAYSSQAGNSFEGWGWSLAGLSAVTRCPRTQTLDGVHGGVNYDLNDRFCLDGQRLMLASGTYGADGSTYNTYVANFAKIVAHGSAGNGPAWFEVHLRSGTVLQLGNTADSQIQAVGKTTIREWLVNKITDTKGNYLTATYVDDQTNGQAYPTRIDYTGNSQAGVATYNSVQFTYTTRSDATPTYQAGSLEKITELLTDIETYTGSSLVHDYKLAYRTGSSTLHSRLTSVTLCDASSNCLAPTTFGWQGGTGTLTSTGTPIGVAQGYGLLYGDFNADGLTDAVVQNTNCPEGGVIFSGSNSGTFTAANMTAYYNYALITSHDEHTYNGPACFLGAIRVSTSSARDLADFEGSGFTEVVMNGRTWSQDGSGDWQQNPYVTYLANDHAGNLNQAVANNAIPSRGTIIGDFNGDGRTDFFTQWSTNPGVAWLSTGGGNFTTQTYPALGAPISLVAWDFDGDGCTDTLAQGSTNALVYFCNPAVASTTVPSFAGEKVIPGDFNGDGKTDLLVVNSTGATLYLSTGTGLSSGYAISGSSTWSNYQIVTGDWNGDGKLDIALIAPTSSLTQHLVFLSTGTDFVQAFTISNSVSGASAVPADWNNDGATDLWIQQTSGDELYNFSFAPEVITSVNNGVGATTSVTYDRINKNGSFYVKGSSAVYPDRDFDAPFYAVSMVSLANGIGGSYATNYTYAGAIVDDTAPPPSNSNVSSPLSGLLGFSKIASTDAQTGIVTTTNFRTDLPYAGLVSSQTVVSGTTTLRSVTNTYADTSMGGGSYAIQLTEAVVAQHDLDGTALPTYTTSYTYDAYNNPHTIGTTVSDGSSRTVTNTFTNDTTNWILGQIATSTVQSIVGSSNLTRHFSFGHDAASGLITQKIQEPSATDNQYLKTDYGYDAYGNVSSVTRSSYNNAYGASRATTTAFDNNGEFTVTLTNALSQSTTWGTASAPTWDIRFGEPTAVKDPNNLTTSTSYDTFGRTTLVTRPDGNKTTIGYAFCSGVNGGSASCPTYGAYVVTTTPQNSSGAQNSPQSEVYYDALGRVIASDVQGFSGSWIRTATQYDANLRVQETSRPYYTSGGTAKWTTYTYDALGRVTQATFPDTSHTTYAYQGLSSSVTNNLSQVTTTVRNAQGLVASVTDAAGHTISDVYDAFGDLTSVTDPLGNVISNTFDLRGRKTASSDPDMGSWTYGYDAFAELTTQTDAKSQSTTLAYDLLGRPTQRVESGLTSNWVYDTAAHGIGSLASACTGSGCTSPANSTYFRAQSYDTLGRPTGTALTISGTTYSYATAYNSDGRVDTVTYPSGFVSRNLYQATYGYLSQIADNGTGSALWTVNARDAEQHLTQGTYGNGVVESQSFDGNTGLVSAIAAGPSDTVANYAYGWDTIGNLTSRTDSIEGYTERFCYDALNRLTNMALGASCTASGTKTVAYDAIGNVSSKTGVGTYGYPASGASSVRPHAVTSITGTVNGVTNPSYSYDANGNMTGGGGRSITPTSFNMAASVVQGAEADCFTYDSEHNRTEMDVRATSCSGTLGSSTIYLNDPVSGSKAEKLVSGSTVTWRDYVVSDNGLTAVRACTGAAPCTSGATYTYVTTDHLGSASVLTDASGSVSERLSYDAWGRRRNANGTDASASSCTTITSQLTRGFTGQEMMDSQCAINFNARLYDPTVARFLSADSLVSDPLNGQSFNRYSYVNNGPLSATDPSGDAVEHSGWNDLKCLDCGAYATLDTMLAAGYIPSYTVSSGGVTHFCNTESCLRTGITSAIGNIVSSGNKALLVENYSGLSAASLYGGAAATATSREAAQLIASAGDSCIPGCGYAEDVSDGADTNSGWFEGTSTFLGGAGLASDVGKAASGAATLGYNLRNVLNWKFSAKGWPGNRYFKMGRIASGLELTSHGLLGLSVGLDVYGYFTNQVSGLKLGADLTMDVIGLTGPVGAVAAGAYYIGDTVNTYYPGGLRGLAQDYSNTLQQERANNPNFYTDPGKISFHLNLMPDALPHSDHKEKKRNHEVINPYDLPLDPGKL